MTKQLILKDLSKLVQKYTTKQGVLIQSLPQDEIFEYPKTDTTVLYRVKGVDIPIIEKTPPQAPPLPLSLLMDLKKYLKDTKSKEIISQYIEQTKQQQLDYEAPIRPIEEEKKKAQKTIEKEKVKEPLALKGTEKALEDMTQIELVKFLKRDDISVSDKKKASKLLIKLQQKPKEMLAIEPAKPAPKKEAPKPAPKKEEAKKEEVEVVREVDPVNLTDEQALKQLEPPIVEDEKKGKIRDRIVEIYKFKDILEGKIKGTLPFKTEEELLQYVDSFKPAKKQWKDNGGNTSTITTPLNQLIKLFRKKMLEEEALKEAEQKRQEEEEEAKALKEAKVEQGKQIVKKKKAKAKAATETK